MTTAPPQDRLRQIAILLSSVDASAARQILLHLPTDAARQVRDLASGLGTVSVEEKRKILADFQRSASSGGAMPPPTNRAAVAHDRNHDSSSNGNGGGSAAGIRLGESSDYKSGSTGGTRLGELSDLGGHDGKSALAQQEPSAAPWTRLSTAALVRFVREERPAVTAVVVSQLAPSVAVEVLQNLPLSISQDVLLRLSRLQDIDPEAMQAIDEHLSQRLQQYHHHIQSEQENTRRMRSLLAAAPLATRQQWSQLLSSELPQLETLDRSFPNDDNQQTNNSQRVPQPSLSEQPSTSADAESASEEHQPSADGHEGADILPFPHPAQLKQMSPVDRSLIQLEFEQILTLSPTLLAHLLSNTESQTVLLALAGATPEFMKRFYRLLDRRDARALQSRLQKIDTIQLRDVDEAQWRIVENAASLRTSRFTTAQASTATARAA